MARRLGGAAAGLALLSLGLLVAGCGSGSSSASSGSAPATTTSGTTTGAGSRSAAFAAYQSCLKSHGLNLPDFGGGVRRPGTGTNGQPPAAPPTGTNAQPPTGTNGRRPGGFGGFAQNLTAKQRTALTACRAELPAGGRGFAGGGRFGGGNGGANGNPAFAKYTACLQQHGVTFGSTSSNPTAFRKAQAACTKLLPATPGAPTTTG